MIENRIINLVTKQIKHQNNVISFLFKNALIDSNNLYLTSNINKIIKKHKIYYLDLFNKKSFKLKKLIHTEECNLLFCE